MRAGQFFLAIITSALLVGCSNRDEEGMAQTEDSETALNMTAGEQRVTTTSTLASPESEQSRLNKLVDEADFAVAEVEALVVDDFESAEAAKRCGSAELDPKSQVCQRIRQRYIRIRTAPEVPSSPDCTQHARDMAVKLCVNIVMNFFDNRMMLNSVSEVSKLPQSCEPFHDKMALEGYEVGDRILESFIGPQNVSEANARAACALQIGLK